MLQRLYAWTLSLAQSPHALWGLAVVAFIEASFFPIPPDIIMIPMIIAAPRKAFLIAGIATVASVLGGLFGYFIGFALFETIGQPIFDFYGKADAVAEFSVQFNDITIMSGVTQLSLPIFIVSAIAARALRFFLVAALLWKFGEPIRTFIEKRLGLMFIVFCVLLFAGFALIGLF
jgi:membrane protein YqaA with SNARE-associated domain